jgi:hypothetical protein
MCQKENRILEDWEEVDHIDDNTMNDNIDNLQILTRTENERKKKIGISCVELVCLFCKRKYLKESRQVKATSKYCSKNCFHRSMKR